MMGHTHALIGGMGWLGFAYATKGHVIDTPAFAVIGGYALASFAALVPDIDTPGSMISRMLGPVGMILSWAVRKIGGGHRKITHSLLGVALVALPFMWCVTSWRLQPWIAAAFVLGYIMHILADMTTISGCPLLWPVNRHNYGLHLITTNKGVEHLVIVPLTLLATGFLGFLLVM